MANEVLGASFNIDITALKTGLAQANRLIKESNSQFKAAAAGMQDWQTSEDGLTAKLKNLNTVADLQQKKVDALQKEYDKCVADGLDPMSAAAVKMRTDINNQQAALNNTKAEIDKYNAALEEMKTESNNSATATQKLKDEIASQESDLASLKSKYADVVLEQGKSSQAAKDLASEIGQLSKKLSDNKGDLNNAEKAADELDKSFDDAGKAAEDAADGGFTVMKGALASLVADGIKSVTSAFGELMTATDKASGNFQAQTGASAKEMEGFNKAMQNVYANNYGEDMNDIADAMANIKQQTKETDPSKLQEMTENALLLRDTFDMDVGESMRAVNMLMEQFGITSEQAFNLVAQGAQNGLNKNDDLLDSINEYSVHYKQQGYSAEQFFNSLANGTAAGTFSVDKLGDAMKEFGIRSKDTATSTDEGFQLIGLSADEMRAKFAAGGETAQKATEETLEALFNMDDQVKQNQAGVDLFGTMWEDLGKDGVKALMDTNGAINLNSDALSQMNDVKYDNLSDAIEGLKRSFEAELMPAINEVLPKIKDGLGWISDNKDIIIGAISGIAAGFAVFKGVPAIISAVNTVMALLNGTMALNPIGIVALAIGALVAAFVILWKKCDSFREFWIDLWEKVKSSASTAWEAIKGFFSSAWDKIKGIWNAAGSFFSGIWNGIKNVFSSVSSWFSNIFSSAWNGIKNIWNKAGSFFSGIWNGIKNVFSSVADWFGKIFSNAWTNITKAFSKVGSFFGGIWNTIKEKFTSIGTKIGDAIGGAFKSAINAVLATVEKAINAVPKAINNALNLINKLPGVNISPMSTISLPRLAKGGLVQSATTALVGEAGNEAVLPLTNKKAMKQIANALAAEQPQNVVVNQTNNYSQAHSRYEIYQSKKATAAAVRQALAGAR